MRNRFAFLTLFAVLPGMNGWAAPAPPTSAILDIGPPHKGETPGKYRQVQIEHLTIPYLMLFHVWRDPEVSKLASVARFEDPRPWMSNNLEVTPVPGKDRLLRLRFRAGSTDEQVAILNSLLRVYLRLKKDKEFQEKGIRLREKHLLDLKKTPAIEQGRVYFKELKSLEDGIAEVRAEIAQGADRRDPLGEISGARFNWPRYAISH